MASIPASVASVAGPVVPTLASVEASAAMRVSWLSVGAAPMTRASNWARGAKAC